MKRVVIIFLTLIGVALFLYLGSVIIGNLVGNHIKLITCSSVNVEHAFINCAYNGSVIFIPSVVIFAIIVWIIIKCVNKCVNKKYKCNKRNPWHPFNSNFALEADYEFFLDTPSDDQMINHKISQCEDQILYGYEDC